MEAGIIMANFVYAIFGVILTLIFMLLGFKLFDRVTPFDTSKQLSDNNIAVGIVVGSIFIGLGIGVYLDRRFDTTPWLTLVFLGFGIAAGYRNIGLAIKKSRKL